MTKHYDRNSNDFIHIGVPFNYTRGNPLPLDDYSLWTSLADAETYAKTNPVAYVGQLLTVAVPGEETATVWIIKNSSGDLEQVGECANAYDKLVWRKDYLFEIDYTRELSYVDAEKFLRKFKPTTTGACTSIRKGNLFGRNLDWTYNNMAMFIIRMKRSANRYASIGMCGNVNSLTYEFVKTQAYSPRYTLLPFITTDGVNEHGVCVAGHQRPNEDNGKTTGTHPGAAVTLCSYMIPRYILDNYKTAQEAVEDLRDNVNIYCAVKDASGNTEESGYIVADKNRTYILEFVHNVAKVIEISAQSWETNFYRTGVMFNPDNTLGYDGNDLTDHAQGVERWNIIAGKYDNIENTVSMMEALKSVWYTQAYTKLTDIWYSEYLGGSLRLFDVIAMPEKFDVPIAEAREKFLNRSRDPSDPNFGTWQTTHSAVYNMDTCELWINHEEGDVKTNSFFSDLRDGSEIGHSHVFVECFDLTCSDRYASVHDQHLSPGTKTIGSITYKGYINSDGTLFVYYNDGKWKLINTTGQGTDIDICDHTKKDEPYLALMDYPEAGAITLFHRHESNDEIDRIVTAATGAVKEYASKDVFPSPGKVGNIYIARDKNKIYRYDPVDGYVLLSGDIKHSEFEHIDPESVSIYELATILKGS